MLVLRRTSAEDIDSVARYPSRVDRGAILTSAEWRVRLRSEEVALPCSVVANEDEVVAVLYLAAMAPRNGTAYLHHHPDLAATARSVVFGQYLSAVQAALPLRKTYYETTDPSQLDRLGTTEGRLRQYRWEAGAWRDVYVISLRLGP
jgi:hypothetical protein